MDELEMLTTECVIMDRESKRKTVNELHRMFMDKFGDTDPDQWGAEVRVLYCNLTNGMCLNQGNWIAPPPSEYLQEIYKRHLNYTWV